MRNLAWTSATGLYEGNAAVLFGEEPSPRIALAVVCEKAQWKAPLGLHFAAGPYQEGLAVPLSPLIATARVAWKLEGPLSAPSIIGDVLVKDFNFGGVPDLRPLWREMDLKRISVRGMESGFLRNSKIQINVSSGEGASVTGTTGAANVDFKVAGTAGAPEWLGEVRLAIRGAAAGGVLEVVPLVLKLAPGQAVPDLEVRGHGVAPGGGEYTVNALGPLGHPVREYQAEAPLSPETVRGVFEEGKGW
jgi:hypothetical protein